MKKFRELIEAPEPREPSEEQNKMVVDIEKSFRASFPNGFSNVSVRKFLGVPSVYVYIGLIKNDKDVPNGIRQNDPMYHSFIINSTKDGKYVADESTGGISLKPEKGSYMAMGRLKTKFRKTTGDAAKIVKTYDTFFKRLKVLIRDNGDNIYGREKYPDIYFR